MLLPWFSSARQDSDSLGIADCKDCKARTTMYQRQSLACGYEPPAPPGIPIAPWNPTGRKTGRHEYDEHGRPRLQICAGYVCNLPEVLEAARGRSHWEKGELVTFCGGNQPSERFIEAIEILDCAVSELQQWRIKEQQEK